METRWEIFDVFWDNNKENDYEDGDDKGEDDVDNGEDGDDNGENDDDYTADNDLYILLAWPRAPVKTHSNFSDLLSPSVWHFVECFANCLILNQKHTIWKSEKYTPFLFTNFFFRFSTKGIFTSTSCEW